MVAEFCKIEYKKQDIKEDAIKNLYGNLSKHYVSVGVHRAEGSEVIGENGFTMVKNACIQEFGNTQTVQKTRRFKSPYTGKWFTIKKGTTINIPPRIFVRVFSNDKIKQNELTQTFKESIELYKNVEPIYKNVGDYARLVMKRRIIAREIKPRNAKMTVEYKGFNHPLVLTGKLMDAIKSEVH